MTKRRNPRAEEAPLQWKTHVGFKQTATKEDMERIRAETLKKMLKASSNLSNELTHQMTNSHSDGSHDAMIIQQQCYLCNAMCSHPSVAEKCVCCERCVCLSCAQKCNGCGYSCCFLCSTIDYTQSDVRKFCLNCIR